MWIGRTKGTIGRVSPFVATLMLVGVLASCTAAADSDPTDTGVRIVTTTTILGDVVRNITGDLADVTTLVPVGVDPHEYQASAQQIAELRQADLVVANGLGLEEGLTDVLVAAAGDGVNVIEIGPAVSPIPFTGLGDDSTQSSSALDPHVWMDPSRMQTAVSLIEAELADVEPSIDWSPGAASYQTILEELDGEIQTLLDPVSSRTLVTNHDSLRYFAERYGFDVIGVVIPGGSTLAEPSSAQLADLIELMREQGTTVIFAETTEPTTLAEAIAAELGPEAQVVELFTGSLGEPGSGVETLVDMLRTDAERIAEALT